MKNKVTTRVGELVFNVMFSTLTNHQKKLLMGFVCFTCIEGLRTSVEGFGLKTSVECPFIRPRTFESENRDCHIDPRLVYAETARCSTLGGSCLTSCLTSFPSPSYMIGFASGFALQTLRRMVVLPAFALPMMSMRN